MDLGERLADLAGLAKYFRAHPQMPWEEFCAKAIEGGYTQGEADLIWWASGIEIINRVEEEQLYRQAQRN